MTLDFKRAVDYILKFADYERMPRSAVVFDLRRIEELLERLGNPHTCARTVHIAGTKGKGSTSAMIASILTQSGYRTGLYTSPHLLSITERIQVDGKPIAGEEWARLTELLKPGVEAVNAANRFGQLTTFEILTALAFLYYRDAKVDYQVLEVGLGGRLDATNVARPEVCVISNISFDHMDVLGNTLASIAREKAGIIKPGAVVVTSPQSPEAMSVIEAVCRERGNRLLRMGIDTTWRRTGVAPEGQSFQLKTTRRVYDLSIPLLGEYQMENAALAVSAAEVLAERGANITAESIADGLARVHWPGRFQIVRRHPWLVIDGAHNAHSASQLGRALRDYLSFDRLLLVVGASSDKDIPGIVAALAPLTRDVLVTQSRHPRSTPPAVLCQEFARFGVSPRVAGTVPAAVALALGSASAGDLICVTGSLFVVAEVMEHLKVSA